MPRLCRPTKRGLGGEFEGRAGEPLLPRPSLPLTLLEQSLEFVFGEDGHPQVPGLGVLAPRVGPGHHVIRLGGDRGTHPAAPGRDLGLGLLPGKAGQAAGEHKGLAGQG